MITQDVAVLDRTTLSQVEQILDAHTRELVPVTKWTAFSWSISRHNTFEGCKRAYYLTYYGGRRVREANSKVVSAVWWLKQLTAHAAWVGTVIHEMAARVLRTHQAGHLIDEEAFTQQAVAYYDDGLQASRRGTRLNKRWVIIREMFYGEPWEQAHERIASLMQALFDSKAYQTITAQPSNAILEVDEPFQTFNFVTQGDTIPVYAIPDVLYKEGTGLHIVDWKTGPVDEATAHPQAQVYGLYAHEERKAAEGNIFVHVISLSDSSTNVTFQPDLTASRKLIQESIHTMQEHMENQAYHTVSISRFPMTDDLSMCATCSFKRVCWRHE